MIALEVLIGLVAIAVLVPSIVLFLEVVAAFRKTRLPVPEPVTRPRVAVLVPAHDEESGIAATVEAIIAQLLPGDRLLVVADNCSDHTAAVAAKAGADVVERSDPSLRGKGYALDFGLQHLATTGSPDVVMIVDADCRVEPLTIDLLARRCVETGRPVQALDLMRDPAFHPRLRLAELAWTLKNQVRPLGLANLGLPCQLMGTGMAFPWQLLHGAKLANGELAEDLQLGIDLTLAGNSPLFCPDACVVSLFPESRQAAQSQRRRWEHGHLQLIMREVPRLLVSGIAARDARRLAMALDLAVPPIALLLMMVFGVGVLAATGAAFGAGGWQFGVVVAAAAFLLAGVGLAWAGWARERVPVAVLAAVPRYVLSKIPLYLAFLARRQKEWVRTERGQ